MDERLLKAIQRDSSATPTNELKFEAFVGAGEEPIEEAPAGTLYGLDPTGDADLANLNPSHILALEQELDEHPESTLLSAQQLWDSDISEAELRDALQKTRAYLEQPTEAVDLLKSTVVLESIVGMPAGWGFEGYDPASIPIEPMNTKFETAADALGYAASFVGAKLANAVKPKAPLPRHSPSQPFVYRSPVADATIGLFSDFGNGLAHSRYIAKHLRATDLDHVIYVGDVYYSGTSKEFASYVAPEIEPFLTGDIASGKKVNVMMLNSNHEMFSKGYSYFSYLKYRLAKGAPQCQQSSYFSMWFGESIQVIGIDTDYDAMHRFNESEQRAWLMARLQAGRAKGAVNVLMSADEPYEYGKTSLTKLHGDMLPFLPLVDFWVWGNTHYCGLFDRADSLPMGTCIGHGGYPYKLSEQKLDKNLYMAPSVATPLFLESKSRYYGTSLRPGLGNNGYVLMKLDTAKAQIQLDYMDWRKTLRYRATLGRANGGAFVMLKGEEY